MSLMILISPLVDVGDLLPVPASLKLVVTKRQVEILSLVILESRVRVLEETWVRRVELTIRSMRFNNKSMIRSV